MEQSPWGANSFSGSEEVTRILCNPNVHYHVHKSPQFFCILSYKINNNKHRSPDFNRPNFKLIRRVQMQIIASPLTFCKVSISMLQMPFHAIMLAVFLWQGCSFSCNLIFSFAYTVFCKCVTHKRNYGFV